MQLNEVTKLITEVSILLGVVIPVLIAVRRISNGEKCLLRSEMLHIY